LYLEKLVEQDGLEDLEQDPVAMNLSITQWWCGEGL
jgi:hypothetical protein